MNLVVNTYPFRNSTCAQHQMFYAQCHRLRATPGKICPVFGKTPRNDSTTLYLSFKHKNEFGKREGSTLYPFLKNNFMIKPTFLMFVSFLTFSLTFWSFCPVGDRTLRKKMVFCLCWSILMSPLDWKTLLTSLNCASYLHLETWTSTFYKKQKVILTKFWGKR